MGKPLEGISVMPPQMFKVRFPDNKNYDVPENDLDAAISMGGEVVDENMIINPLDASRKNSPNIGSQNALQNNKQNMAENLKDIDYNHINYEQPEQIETVNNENSSPSRDKIFQVKFPDNKTYEVPEKDLQKAASMGGKIVTQEKDSIGKLVARSAKTIGSEVIGSVPDLATSVYNIPATLENAKTPSMKKNSQSYFVPESPFPEASVYPDAQLPIIPSVAHAIDSSIDKATDDYTKTEEGDSLQSGLRLASAVATPGGLAKAATKLGQKGVAKGLGALGTTEPIGLAAAGTTGIASEEAAKSGYGAGTSIGLGLAAGAGVGTVGALSKALNTKLALAKLTGNSPKNINLEAVDAAASAGLEIPNTIANESKSLAHFEQVISKAPYFGTKYAKKLNESDKSYANKVQEAIKNVGEKLVDSESSLDIGNMIKETFNKVKQSVIDEKDALYDAAIAGIPQGAKIVPTHTIKTMNKIKDSIQTLRADPAESFLLNYINDVQPLMGKSKPIPVMLIAGSKRSLNGIIDWDKESIGAAKRLKEIQHAYKEDLKKYGKINPEWYKKFSKADNFYGKYLGDKALGSDTLKKIYSQENPEKIIENLKNISDFEKLSQSLGHDKSGQQFFNSIKREKLVDLISGKVVNQNSDTVSYLGFSKALENKQNKELIKYLAGDNYSQLEKLNTYAKAATRHKSRNPNPSGTAPTKLIYTMLTGGVGGALTKGVVGAVTGLTGPLALGGVLGSTLSWLLTNKKALNWGIEAARKQASGKYKAAETISNRLVRLMKEDLGDDVAKQFIAISKEYANKPNQQD
jgi:hypothetical protein